MSSLVQCFSVLVDFSNVLHKTVNSLRIFSFNCYGLLCTTDSELDSTSGYSGNFYKGLLDQQHQLFKTHHANKTGTTGVAWLLHSPGRQNSLQLHEISTAELKTMRILSEMRPWHVDHSSQWDISWPFDPLSSICVFLK